MLIRALVLTVAGTAVVAAAQSTPPPLTCDPAGMAPDSYRLTTGAQALIVTEPRGNWWESFNVGKHADDLYDLNMSSEFAAERALQIDPRNLMAHAILARQLVVLGENGDRAEHEWQAVLDNGGAIVWTATLYDVDYKSYFVLAFDRQNLRVYRFGQFAAPFETRMGMPQFPGPERSALWEALGGCIDRSVSPAATIPWSDVREIKAGNWVLWFKLARGVAISSDRDKKSELHEIKVNLHGATGTVEFSDTVDPITHEHKDLRGVGIGPTMYQDRVRRVIAKFVDPEGRIALPKVKRGAGW